MSDSAKPARGFVRELLREEARLLPRLRGVFRFDPAVYAEIEDDAHATPAGFAVVIGTSLLVGLGQAWGAYAFLAVAGAILSWGLASALVWAVGALFFPETSDYPRLLRCLGFAFAWNMLQLGAGIPVLGALLLWAAILLWGASMVLVVRQVVRVPTAQAAAICLAALALPILLLWVAA